VERTVSKVDTKVSGADKDPVVPTVLGLVNSPGAKAALRRGGMTATEHYAYPYLARFWMNAHWRREPTLALGHLVAVTGVRHDPGVSLGVALRRRVTSGGLSETSAERKLAALQDADLDRLVPQLRALLTSCTSVDWFDVHRSLRKWDDPDLEVRRKVRRRVLEQFYSASSDINESAKGNKS